MYWEELEGVVAAVAAAEEEVGNDGDVLDSVSDYHLQSRLEQAVEEEDAMAVGRGR